MKSRPMTAAMPPNMGHLTSTPLLHRITRQAIAASLVASLVCSSSPSWAEESATSEAATERSLDTEGKVLLYTAGGLTIVGLTFMTVSLVARESAISRHDEFPDGGRDCRTTQECADLASAREDADAWTDRAAVAAGITIGAGVTTALVALFWPRVSKSTAKIAPSATTTGATLGVYGSF